MLIGISVGSAISCSLREKPRIGVSVATMQEAVYSFMKQAMLDHKDTDQVDLIWVSAENSEAKQRMDVQALISQGIKVLILHPVNTESAKDMVDQASRAGIAVIAMDRLPTGSHVQLYVTADSRKVGELQAEHVANTIGEKGNVIILEGEAGNVVAQEITAGNLDTFKKYPQIRVALRRPHKNWARDLAGITTEDALKIQSNNIQAILANNSQMILGALDVLAKMNRTSRMATAGADADREACQAILAGRLSADVDKMPYDLGLAAYRAALQLIRNEPPASTGTIDNGGVEVKVLFTPVRLITRDNVQQAMAYRWGKL